MTDIIIASLGGNCPVQATGTIDGEPFYFRARGEHWSIEIGPGNTDRSVRAMEDAGWSTPAADAARDAVEALPVWRYEEEYRVGEQYAAGWMSEDEARAFITKGAELWRAQKLAPESSNA